MEEQLTIQEVAEQEEEIIKGATRAYILKGNPKPVRVPVTTKLIRQKAVADAEERAKKAVAEAENARKALEV